MKIRSKILIIAGSDSSGGAGIQADIKTATCLGNYAMTAITAVTIQNTQGVRSVVSIPPSEIYNQIYHTTKDIQPDAIKIGMLHSTQVINKVFDSLNRIKVKKIILDPVMIAKGGSKLISDQAITLMRKKLLKKITLITPNIPEAEILTGININTKKDMISAANKLIHLGVPNVLIKGGHLNSKKVFDNDISPKHGHIDASNHKHLPYEMTSSECRCLEEGSYNNVFSQTWTCATWACAKVSMFGQKF